MNTTITIPETKNILAELETAFHDIPFENSNFQNEVFVIAAQQTPARAYRAIGLRMFAKIRAIKELEFGRKLEAVDIDEKNAIIADPSKSEFEKRRAAIEIEKLLDSHNWADKLLNDALRELDCLHKEFKKFPQYTREEFEIEEKAHFQLKLERQIQTGGGALESLANMQIDDTRMDAFLENPALIDNIMADATQRVLIK